MKVYGNLTIGNGECLVEFEGDRQTGKIHWLQISTWISGTEGIRIRQHDPVKVQAAFPLFMRKLEAQCRKAPVC